MFNLSGKRVLVTGAAGGIGKELSKSFLEVGADIILSGTNINRLQSLKDDLNQECEVYKCDLKNVDEINDLISKEIDSNEVCLFMKGTPDAPQCGFSMAVSNMLKILEVNFKGVNVLENEKLRQGIKEFSDWPTIPQLYIKKEFVGGCDIVKEMYENGELKKVLEDKGINFKK